jgi:hypothetical protein
MFTKRALKIVIPWMILGLSIILGGCEKPPSEEMEAAETALTRAENDPDAAAFAENSLIRARDAVSRMRTAAEAKQFNSAKSYAAEAVSLAEKAITDGRAAAQRGREEAAALIVSLKASLAETQTAFERAKQIANTGLDFDALGRDLDTARRLVEQAEIAAAGNSTQAALELGRSARAALGDLDARLASGVWSLTRKK